MTAPAPFDVLTQLLIDLYAANVRVRAVGSVLVFDAGAERLTSDQRLVIHQREAQLVSLLHWIQDSAHDAFWNEAQPAPELRCAACCYQRLWRSIHDVTVCARCHPPADPALVKEWIGVEGAGR